MNISGLLNQIEHFAPFELCSEWDNSGLMVGSRNCEVVKIALCLDAVHEAVTEAADLGCNVLLTHHPLIFRGLKQIDIDSEQGLTIKEAINHGINIIALHTNWDRASEGVNFQLAKLLGLKDCEYLSEFGIKGVLPEKISLQKFLECVKISWNLTHLDCYGTEREIRTVAICGGSGSQFWPIAKSCDIYLTADMKYHEIIDASRAGLAIALSDHGEMERASLNALEEKLNEIPELQKKIILLNINAINNYRRI